MGYRLLAEATMVAHFAFMAYVVAGGFLAWRWPVAVWPHLVLAGWGLTTIVITVDCPLTLLEDWARRRAGQRGLPDGFVDHYLTGVIYPERYHVSINVLAVLVIAVSWIGLAIRIGRRTGSGAAPKQEPAGRRFES